MATVLLTGAKPGPDRRLAVVREEVRQGHFAVAESLGRVALDEAGRNPGRDSARVLEALDTYVDAAGRGVTAWSAEVRTLAEHAARLHERRDGPSHVATAASWVRLSRPLIATSRLDSAQTLLDRALEIFRRRGAAETPRVVEALLVRAALDFRRGADSLQLVHAREALALAEGARPPDSLAIALASSAIGRSMLSLDRDEEGGPWFARADAVLERHAPPHRERAAVINNLGVIARGQGDYLRTVALFERALAITSSPRARAARTSASATTT